MTLEKTRQELRMAQRVIMDQKREIGELQFQVSTYKHLAGLGPEEIEIEVRERMEKYVADLKNHLGKMGQQLLDATSSLGDAMDICLSVSWQPGGSCRSSTASNMSVDEGNQDRLVRAAPRASMFQEEAPKSDPAMKSAPQRIACLDMSVITEQSILLDDMALPADFPIDEDIQEDVTEDGNSAPIEHREMENKSKTRSKERDKQITEQSDSTPEENQEMENKSKARSKDRNSQITEKLKCAPEENLEENKSKSRSKERKSKAHTQSNSEPLENPEEKKSKSRSKARNTKAIEQSSSESETPYIETKGDNSNLSQNPKSSEECLPKDNIESPAGNKSRKRKKSRKDEGVLSTEATCDPPEAGSKKDRRGTFVVKDSDLMPASNNVKDRKNKTHDDVKDDKKSKNDLPKNRRETFVLIDSEQKTGKEVESAEKADPCSKERRETFLVPKDTLPVLSQKDRRGTFVLPSPTQSLTSSKSEEKIDTDKSKHNPQTSKSDSMLTTKDDKRKTFVVPSGKDAFLMPPPPVNSKKAAPEKVCEDPEVTEYFNCDMDFTEVIDNSNRIVIEPETNGDPSSKVNNKVTQGAVNGSSRDKSKSPKEMKKDKNDKNEDANKKVKGHKEEGKGHTAEKKSDAVEFRLPKPGKIVFAASRKAFDGSREKVPSKLPQKSRSKSKVKLTKSTSDDTNVNSMFDFHEKTPVFLRHGPSVYDMSLNESVHAQKESYGAFRDKINKPSNNDNPESNQQNSEEKKEKLKSVQEPNGKAEKKEPNDKGEIIYHVPLKGCSPDTPKVKSRSKSKGRERSKSRGRDKNDDKMGKEDNSTSRSRSRGRSRSRKIDNGNDNEETCTEAGKEEGGDSEAKTVGLRRGRSRSRSCRQEVSEDEGTYNNENRSKSRSRSAANICYKEADSEEDEVDSQKEVKGRSKSRGRSRTRKTDPKIINDAILSVDMADKSTRSKSRGRSKSHSATIEDNTSEPDLDKIQKSRSKSKSRSSVQADGEVEQTKTKRSRSKPARSLPVEQTDFSDEDFKDPIKSGKKTRTKSVSGDIDDNLNPLDRLFKSTKKKSLSEIDFGIYDILASADENINISNQQKKSFDFSETPVKSKDIQEKSIPQILVSESPLSDKVLIGDEHAVNLKCVTKRGRSRSKKVNKPEEMADMVITGSTHGTSKENDDECLVTNDSKRDDDELVPASARDLEVLKSASKDGRGKRRHDSVSSETNTGKKKKRPKTENKENEEKQSKVSLSVLKKKLKSLGGAKAETAGTPVEDLDVGVAPLQPLNDQMTTASPVVRKSSVGTDLKTPDVNTENSEGHRSRRRAGNVCYKEVSLNQKMRREDVLQGKK